MRVAVTQQEAIRTIVGMSAERGGFLVRNADRVRDALNSAIVGGCLPAIVFEMPLGDGATDVMAVYRHQHPVPDDTCRFRDTFEWFSTIGGFSALYVTFDVLAGTAGAYLEFGDESSNVAPFAESLGLDPTWVTGVIGRIPEGWPVHYVGYFPDRDGSPLRIGGYISSERVAELRDDPDDTRRLHPDMADLCRKVSTIAAGVGAMADWQLDVMSDGSLGPRVSIGVSISSIAEREVRHVLSSLGVGVDASSILASMRFVEVHPDCVFEMTPSMVKVSNSYSTPKAYVSVTATPRWT